MFGWVHGFDVGGRDAGSNASPAGSSVALTGLVAVTVVLALELIRSTGPILDQVFASQGLEAAVNAALLTYLAPAVVVGVAVLVAIVLRRRSDRVILLGCAALLAGVRMVAQTNIGQSWVGVGLAAVAVSVAMLVLAVAVLSGRPGGGPLAASAVATGVAVAVALQLVLGTWDAYWRSGWVGWAASGVVAAVLLVLAMMASRSPRGAAVLRPRRVWALGPFLALTTLIVGSVPFAASQSGLSTWVAGPILAIGMLGAVIACSRWSQVRGTRHGLVRAAASALALPALILAVLRLPADAPLGGAAVMLALLGCQVIAILALGAALEPGPDRRPVHLGGSSCGVVGLPTVVAAAVVGLGAIVPMLLYQMDYDTPLGFPNYLVLVAAAALLGGAGARVSGPPTTKRAVTVARPVLAAAAATVAFATATAIAASVSAPATGLDSPTPTEPGEVRVMVWNLHYGVGETGDLHLEAIARAIERHDADVVLLNEVARGWIIGGAADMGSWLSNRLGGYYAYAPAADRQFGNALISRWPLQDPQVHRLPYGEGPQYRSALSATVATPAGDLTVVAVHLQQHRSSQPTRILQLQTLLPRLAEIDRESTIVGGDFNAIPGEPEIAMMQQAGYFSAVDEVGDPTAFTIPSSDPTLRYDWLFGRDVRFTQARVLSGERASDHLPILATVVP